MQWKGGNFRVIWSPNPRLCVVNVAFGGRTLGCARPSPLTPIWTVRRSRSFRPTLSVRDTPWEGPSRSGARKFTATIAVSQSRLPQGGWLTQEQNSVAREPVRRRRLMISLHPRNVPVRLRAPATRLSRTPMRAVTASAPLHLAAGCDQRAACLDASLRAKRRPNSGSACDAHARHVREDLAVLG